ncbi:amidase family protein [Byssothecium circinans]|uniref:Amidase family protein n=1 Tax=Byssothecium circinans TaxID=147558 RepID=A0A6A5TPI9_9PLEO|nr:amidase family protein [Byssothecium circinans]
MSPIDPFTATAADLQAHLAAGRTTTSALVDLYSNRIAKDNDYLRAVISTTPRQILDAEAKRLDDERESGKVRSALHGIPILLKDNIATHPNFGLDTTGGSLAFAGSRPHRHAEVAQRLIDAGALILGKASLSELNFYRSEGIPCAWCAVSGQGQSAYVRGGFRDDDTFGGHSNPGGSSSGPAISVSAGFAPVSIGAETIGSLIMPADRAALYTLKPTVGLVSQAGLIPVSPLCDSAGPMTKTTRDLADLLDVLIDPSKTKIPEGGYASAATGKWDSIRIGVLNPEDWLHGEQTIKPVKIATEQLVREVRAAYEKLAGRVEVKEVSLISWAEAAQNGDKVIDKCFDSDYAKVLQEYLDTIDNSKVKSLDELIQWNKDHSDVELPPRYDNQNGLIRAQKSNISKEEYDEILSHSRRSGRENGIDKTLKENGVDVILGPGDGPLFYIAGIAGYPIASLPLSYLDFNGRPFGLVALATAHQESLLVQVQSAWEATFPKRQPPALFTGKSEL